MRRALARLHELQIRSGPTDRCVGTVPEEQHLLEANLVLYRIAVDGDGELGQGAGSGGADVILAIATSS